MGQYTYAYNRRCRSGGHKALYEFLIEISVINAYKLSLHSDVSKEAKYTVHSEFRTALATGLIQTSERQFLKRKRTSIGPAIERSMIRLDDHQICRRKSLGDCRGCKEIDLTVGPRKRQVLGEITPNLGGSKRGKRSIFGCDICDIPLCKTGPCWAAYHNSIWIVSIKSVQGDILWFSIGGLSEYAKSGFPTAVKGIRYLSWRENWSHFYFPDMGASNIDKTILISALVRILVLVGKARSWWQRVIMRVSGWGRGRRVCSRAFMVWCSKRVWCGLRGRGF